MRTPLIILVLLITPYVLLKLRSLVSGTPFDMRLAGSFGLGVVFVFTGNGHFARTKPMAEMLPPWVPYRIWLVYLTGILEFLIAATLFTRRYRWYGAWTAIIVLVVFFPANIYAAINQVGMGGHVWGPIYLLIRTPLQAVLIFWAYWFVVRKEKIERT